MTAQQRTLASPGFRSRAIGLALATAFGVGLASGLAAPRILSQAPALARSVAAPAAQPNAAAPAPRLQGNGAGPLPAGGVTVNPYTGFTIGPLVESPIANPYTGFVVGWQLYQASEPTPTLASSGPSTTVH